VIVARARDELAGLRGDLAVSVGVFDGVHRGHQAVLRMLAGEAASRRESTLVVTLDPHPLEVLRPESAPPLLTTPAERCGLLERFGGPPDAVLVHRFDRDVARLSPAEFLDVVVPGGARLARLVLGYDFRMGRDRSGGVEELAALGAERGFEVKRVAPARDDGDVVSSSRIRRLIAAGDVAAAATLLGHAYRIDGGVVPGRGVGRGLGFPTANVAVPDRRKLLPAHGVYAVRVRLPGEAALRPGVMNFGSRPTFPGAGTALEVHLPGFDGRLDGRPLVLELAARLRDEKRFEGPRDLAAAIAADVERARRILREGP
jgi:riboflavin kinase/FMN adenylyltransferase